MAATSEADLRKRWKLGAALLATLAAALMTIAQLLVHTVTGVGILACLITWLSAGIQWYQFSKTAR